MNLPRGSAEAAQQTHNLQDVGPNPIPATNFLVDWMDVMDIVDWRTCEI